jgi:hypothetical protein
VSLPTPRLTGYVHDVYFWRRAAGPGLRAAPDIAEKYVSELPDERRAMYEKI